MPITVTNQQLAVLDPVHTITCRGDYDPVAAMVSTVLDPLRTPLNPNAAVSIVDDQGNDISGALADLLLSCVQDGIDPDAELVMKQLLGQTLVHYDQQSPLPVGELFAAQAGQTCNLPAPTPRVIYSARGDVIPTAKALLSGTGPADGFFASLAFTFHPDTVGFWFRTSADFDDFKAWVVTQTQALGTALPSDTQHLLTEFDKLSLHGLTESLQLRTGDADGNDEFSFARVIVNMAMSWVQLQSTAGQAPASGVLPFTIGELFCPLSVVLVNVEAHARARANRIVKEWQLINQALASPVKVVSHRQLAKLTSMQRARAKAAAQAAQNQANQKNQSGRSARVAFRRKPSTQVDLVKDLTRVLKRMGTVNRSQNVYRRTKATFLKVNRRDPDDYNKPGRSTSVNYLPDLHVYVDTSGSISEDNYREAMTMLIGVAKKLNINLYFNSFSDVLSQESLIRVENKSLGRIWQEFSKVPKVTGGTDYRDCCTDR